MNMRYYLILLFLVHLNVLSFAQFGVVDPTYGQNGYKQIAFDLNPNEISNSVGVCRDGNGYTYIIGYTNNQSRFIYQLIKLDQFGNPVSSFGTKGRISFDPLVTIVAIKIDVLGNIYVAGLDGNNSSYFVFKFKSDGNLDLSYGSQGKFVYQNSNSNKNIHEILIDYSGNIFLLIGIDFKNNNIPVTTSGIIKINKSGLLDNTFGVNGLLTLQLAPNTTTTTYNGEKPSFVFDKENNIYACETSFKYLEGHAPIVKLVKLSINGVLINSFGENGVKIINNFGEYFFTNKIIIDNSSNIIIGGMRVVGSRIGIFVAAFTLGGNLIITFAQNGIADISTTNVASINTIVQDDENNFYILINYRNYLETVIYKIDGNGQLKTNFGNYSGRLVISNGSSLNDMVIDKGKLYLSGSGFYIVGYRYNVSCIDLSGQMQTTFGFNGVSYISTVFYDDGLNYSALTIDHSDNIVICSKPINNITVLMKINNAGESINDYGFFGKASINIGTPFNVTSMVSDLNDNIFLAGVINKNGKNRTTIVKVNKNGELVTDFGSAGIVIFEGINFEGIDLGIESIKILLDNSADIIISGTAVYPNVNIYGSIYSKRDIVVLKFSKQGVLNSSFGSNGVKLINIRNNILKSSSLNDFAIDYGDNIILVGESDYENSIIKLAKNGEYKSDFGNNGFLSKSDFNKNVNSVTVDSDGNIYAIRGEGHLFILKLSPQGEPNNCFGTLGISKISAKVNDFYSPEQILIDKDYNIYVSLISHDPFEQQSVIKIYPNGSLSSNFGLDGKFTYLNGNKMHLFLNSSNNIISSCVSDFGASNQIAFGHRLIKIENSLLINTQLQIPTTISVSVPNVIVCANTPTVFTAIATNPGVGIKYQWFKNNTLIVGETNSTYSTATLSNTDIINVAFISNKVCPTNPVVSNKISMTVNYISNYYSFDGINDRVQIPSKTNYNLGTGDFTIEVEVSMNPTSDPYEPILARRVLVSNNLDGFLLFEMQGQLLFQINQVNYFSEKYGNIRDNFLHKIAVVRKSSVLRFYLDGTLIGSVNSFSSMNSIAPLYVGYDAFENIVLNGTISNVHFWSVGKNAGELYQTNIPANAPGLLGNWKLNECAGQGVQDFGPLANHGVLGTTTAVESLDPQRVVKNFSYGMQNALNLSSGSNNAKHGEVPHSGVYDFNQNFTIEAIIQGSNGAVSTFPSIFSKRNSASDGFGFGIYNGRIYVSIGGTSYYDTNTGYNLYTYPFCAHIALTRRLVNGVPVFGVYVNGVLTYSFINRSNLNTSAPIWIGNDNGRNNVFNASIDEIRIWNVFKMPADLAANINTVFNTSTPNLLGYYRFKEESHAQWLKDESAINNYGYLGSSTSSDGNDPSRTVLACYGNSRTASNDIAIDSEPSDTLEVRASVYPNPFENTARLKIVNLDSDVTIQIIDAAGRLVYTKENHPATDELLIGEDLPQGMYIIHFVGQPVLKPIKFIKVF